MATRTPVDPGRPRRRVPPAGGAIPYGVADTAEAREAALSNFDLGPLGIFKLDSIREVALRAGRLAEVLFNAFEADVIAVQDGRVWRGKGVGDRTDDAAARILALGADQPLWISDTLEHPTWRHHPGVQGPNGIRFCALAPIRTRHNAHLGALRVFDHAPRAFDPALAAALEDLAAFVADECHRLLGGEVRRLRELFDKAPGFMAITTGPDHVFELANEAYMEIVGQRDLVGRSISNAIPWAEDQGFKGLLDDVYALGEAYVGRAAELLVDRGDGEPPTTAYADFVCQPIHEADNTVSGVFMQGHDVTRATLAAAELEARSRDLAAALKATQTIFDKSLDVIATMDIDGTFLRVSRHCEAVWGYRPDEMVGRRYIDFIHPDDVAASLTVSRQIRAGASTKAFTNRYVHKDGSLVPMMWSSTWSAEEATSFAVARDMREHAAAEEMLRQAQKMEAVGQLTGGIAHDFNNLLTVVIGSTEFLAESLAGRPDLQPTAQLALDAAEKGAELVSRLLAYSRKQPLAAQPIDCKAFMEDLLPILTRTLGEHIEVEVTVETGARCLADPTQLTSALLNLAINARDAMPDGGRLMLSVGRADEGPKGRAGAGAHVGFVVFSVRDTGPGMSPDLLSRVLEPFFTTKPSGQGSGLGLSMVYGFANQSGGRLTLESALGRGTCAAIHLPESSRILSRTPDAPGVTPASPGRHVMVVEDDDLVRRQTESHLAILGYRVSVFPNARLALERLAGDRDIDLLLTDIVMPGGMNGSQLAVAAKVIIPDLRIVFTSGYSSDAVRRAELGDREIRFLGKPYRRADLARTLLQAFNND